MAFSEWLQEQLNFRKITGAELAERAGISKASAYSYLDGSRMPGPHAVQKLCATLGVPDAGRACADPRYNPSPMNHEVSADYFS
jgi:transcriptional regulator with XRE-family HTH domain